MESIEDASQIEASAASLNLPEVSILFENVLGTDFFIIIHWSKLRCSCYDLLLFFSCPQEGASFYDIDNEEYEAMSVEVRLLPRKLRFFCSAERREQLAQAQWWWLCWSVERRPRDCWRNWKPYQLHKKEESNEFWVVIKVTILQLNNLWSTDFMNQQLNWHFDGF